MITLATTPNHKPRILLIKSDAVGMEFAVIDSPPDRFVL